jgi:hypothetical protein
MGLCYDRLRLAALYLCARMMPILSHYSDFGENTWNSDLAYLQESC